ncbi:MAG: polyprenyl synthetase family protein [Dehalococcoidia bacterium]|nr:polyprenyl synthetase family protein [Dehalococcoidia bacterium]
MNAATLADRLPRYRSLVSDELRAVVGGEALPLWAWMRYHLGWEDEAGAPVDSTPGKLLRPVAVLLTAETLGTPPKRAVPAAAAVELIHNFSLLHDDIEDRSERRRDRPTLWTRTGVPQAINTGDGMHTLARLALLRLGEQGFEAHTVLEAARELDEACLRLVHGQHLDIAMEGRADVTRAAYLEMSSGKTAAMFAAPFAIGAVLGGGETRTVEAFRTYGHHVGMAFQAADDLLGIWGDPAITGKAASDDLRQRKMTLPVIAAIESGGDEASALARDYAIPPAPAANYAGLAARIERLGGRAAAAEFAAAEERAALDALAPLNLTDGWRAAFEAYAGLASFRDA